MAIYGREPATDNMLLVVCEICGRVVKSQALLKHKGQYSNIRCNMSVLLKLYYNINGYYHIIFILFRTLSL